MVVDIDAIWKEMSLTTKPSRKKKQQSHSSEDFPLVADKKGSKNNNQRADDAVVEAAPAFQWAAAWNVFLDTESSMSRRRSSGEQCLTFYRKELLEENNVNEIKLSSWIKPLLKISGNDRHEALRLLALSFLQEILQNDTTLDLSRDLLPYLFPVLNARRRQGIVYDDKTNMFYNNADEVEMHNRGRLSNSIQKPSGNVEPSEEVRLSTMNLVNDLVTHVVKRSASSLLHPYFYDLICFIAAALADNFPDLLIKTLQVTEQIVHAMPSGMKHFSIAFVRLIAKNSKASLLTHRLSKVRIAAINALSVVVACPQPEKCKGAGTEAIVELLGQASQEQNVIPISAFYRADVTKNIFGLLDTDRNPKVRLAFYQMIANWLLKTLPDRYDHERRLLPFLLSGLYDEDLTNSTFVSNAIEACGKRHEEENQEALQDTFQYGLLTQKTCNYSLPWPAPFEKRPRLGARLYIKSKCRCFIPVLVKECRNWSEETRLHAARLLSCITIYSEESITQDISILLKHLMSQQNTDDIIKPYDLTNWVGRFVSPKVYIPIVLKSYLSNTAAGTTTTYSERAFIVNQTSSLLSGSLATEVCCHSSDALSSLLNYMISSYDECRDNIAAQKLLIAFSNMSSVLSSKISQVNNAMYSATGRLEASVVLTINATYLVYTESAEGLDTESKQKLLRFATATDKSLHPAFYQQLQDILQKEEETLN